MLTLPQALAGYFKTHFGLIRNTSGILFSYYRGVSAECPLPGYHNKPGEALVQLVIGSPSLADFVQDFSLRSIGDMYRITAGWMHDRYKRGKAEICCMLNDYHARTLYFRLERDAMYTRDSAGHSHRVPVILASPAEIINYTRRNA